MPAIDLLKNVASFQVEELYGLTTVTALTDGDEHPLKVGIGEVMKGRVYDGNNMKMSRMVEVHIPTQGNPKIKSTILINLYGNQNEWWAFSDEEGGLKNDRAGMITGMMVRKTVKSAQTQRIVR